MFIYRNKTLYRHNQRLTVLNASIESLSLPCYDYRTLLFYSFHKYSHLIIRVNHKRLNYINKTTKTDKFIIFNLFIDEDDDLLDLMDSAR